MLKTCLVVVSMAVISSANAEEAADSFDVYVRGRYTVNSQTNPYGGAWPGGAVDVGVIHKNGFGAVASYVHHFRPITSRNLQSIQLGPSYSVTKGRFIATLSSPIGWSTYDVDSPVPDEFFLTAASFTVAPAIALDVKATEHFFLGAHAQLFIFPGEMTLTSFSYSLGAGYRF